MKIKELIEELEENKSYKTFKIENPSAFFVSGFFMLDVKEKTEQIQLDFFLPEKKRIASFEFPFNKLKIFDDEITDMSFQDSDVKVDIGDLETICRKVIDENGSPIVLAKIIAILKDNQWNLTCIDDMLGIVRIKINAISGKLEKFEKTSLMNFVSVLKKDK